MSQERILELHRLLYELDRKIKPLEWDNARNQINEFKKKTLEKLKEEHTLLSRELSQELSNGQELGGSEIQN